VQRVFVSEYITSGAWADRPLVGSLATEGQAMLVALAEDLADDPGIEVVTTWDSRLGEFPVTGTRAFAVETTLEADERFRQLAGSADRTLVVAPEIDGLLENRSLQVSVAGGTWVGCPADTIALCSDKLATAQHLRHHRLNVVDTRTAQVPRPDSERVVWKPRDGAGSQGISTTSRTDPPPHPDSIVQPLVQGRHVSVAVICGDQQAFSLPVAEQHLSSDGRFTYQGGKVPCFPLDSPQSQAIRHLAEDACRSLGHARGWMGVDLVLLEDNTPVIMEINPRLTTSFLGYRQLAAGFPLSQLVISPETAAEASWDWCHTHSEPVEFTCSGSMTGGG
jgi:predicted ATP-grasp superfamily ATP-dependent carboligase